jgi:muramoyltetrapeptide carboxypeptidase
MPSSSKTTTITPDVQEARPSGLARHGQAPTQFTTPSASGREVVGLRAPPALKAGDTVAVVAPSSPFPATLVWVGLGWLAQRYRLRFDRGLFTRRGYLAGDDERRRVELEGALSDPTVRAIFCARGGYGASRFAHALDWSKLARDPKWIVGFSDITALHTEAERVGVASLHAPHVTALGRADQSARAAMIDALEAPFRARVVRDLTPMRAGEAEGPLVGGNLTILHSLAAAGRLAWPPGAIVLLEDVTERPYRVDRALTTMMVGGAFSKVGGVVLGDFTQCEPGPDGVRIEDVLAERLGGLGVPVARGLRVGHGDRNDPIFLGAHARLSVTSGQAELTTRLVAPSM